MKMFMVLIFLMTCLMYFSNARCCWKHKGFCKDCSRGRSRFSCCTSTEIKCNVFCCGCSKCLAGRPRITKVRGWWFLQKYKCLKEEHYEGDVDDDATQSIFDGFDHDGDNHLSLHEFYDAVQTQFGIMQREIPDGPEEGIDLEDELLDFDEMEKQNLKTEFDDAEGGGDSEGNTRRLLDEFVSMDTNNDGRIQASEFDTDLS